MELLNVLGINYKILIAQLVNFAVLFLVLYKFAYKPMLKMLDDRKEKIENGVRDAEAASQKIIDLEKKEIQVIQEAKREALAIIEKAKDNGELKKKDIIEKAKQEIGELINKEKAKMRSEKADTLKEIKREVSELVVLSVEKILEEKIDKKKDNQIISQVILEQTQKARNK